MPTRREKYEQRLASLKNARASWETPWREITEQLVPYRVVWDRFKRNRGDKEESKIINNTPVLGLQTLAAGMMAGITSPARDWFGLTTADPELAEHRDVKVYLDKAEEVVRAMLAGSNWYTSLANGTYLDLGSIGTSAMFHEEGDPGDVRFSPLPIGEYFLDQDHSGQVDTCYRELDMTVRQVVKKFGRDACSDVVKRLWDEGKYDQTVQVVHAVQPNDEYDYGQSGPRGMGFSSCWWDKGDQRKDVFLRESGYEEFPVLAPRWFVRPGDVYGRGPGWAARGDCRVLQLHEKRLLSMIDKITDPPMKVSEGISRASLLPGDKTYMPEGAERVFEPAMEVAPGALEAMHEHIMRAEQRIKETMYVHLWQAMINDERNERPTATEVEAKRQEIMLMLGPLLENLNGGLLEPAIERTFNIALRTDQLPPVPEELNGQEIKIKFLSIMHQMQQVTGLAGIRTLLNETANLAQLRADAIDKLNSDVIVDELVRITGVRSDAVLSKDEVDEVRRQKAEQAQAKQTGEAMLQATAGAKNLSGFSPQTITDVAGALSPAAQAQGGALGPAAG